MTVQIQKETLGFQTEVKQLLYLMINSLYSNKEIFLRELISNASDATDKLRFEALSNSKLYENDSDLRVFVDYDKTARTITITDNGIGMTREEVIQNIGTIAKSGTREFLSTLTGEQVKDTRLIGQFGVGFYSAFIVANKVTLITRRAGLPAEEGVRWESEGQGEFTIETVNKPTRGTEIILHLKAGEDEFLDDYRLRHIIQKYSDHISLPVRMKMVSVEKTEDEKSTIDMTEETINRAKAIWLSSKNELTDDDYKEFYKHIAHDFEDPLVWAHNRVEGKLEYSSLLYLPARAPFDLWNREHRHGLKLYIQRVFIMDNAEQFLPNYLRFVRGVIDSNDLPLNISREILQSSKVVDSIRAALVKRVLDLLENLAETEQEKYAQFWTEFGEVLKEGPGEDFINRERIAKLLRFASTHAGNETQNVALADYVSRMKEGQEPIYYIAADTFAMAKNSPHLEVFRNKGLEVLLLSHRVDEWLMSHLTEYEGKPFKSITQGDLDLGKLEDEQDKQQQEVAEKDYVEIIKQVKEVLGDRVKDVRLSHRLTTSPSCLIADNNDVGRQLQRLLKQAGQPYPMSKPILELNPQHALVSKLKLESNPDRFKIWVMILFNQAVLAEGGQLEDPAGFVQQLNQVLLDKE